MAEEGLDRYLAEQNATLSSFRFVSSEDIASWALKEVEVSQTAGTLGGSLIELIIQGPLTDKMVDYLNASISELQADELRQKNLMASNSIDFIDRKLIETEEKLRSNAMELEAFRANNLIVDLSSEGNQMLEYFELEESRAVTGLQGHSQVCNRLPERKKIVLRSVIAHLNSF